MKSLLQLQEQPKRVAFTFGRFNPPTTGHEKLIQKLANQGGEIMVFPSHSQDPKKNPLPHPRKIAYMKKMFPRYSKSIMTSKARNVFEISTDLYNKGYTDITMVVGSDRVKEFDALLKKYNGVKGTHGFYDFDSISVVSAGERDPDAEGVEGMSASKMRAAAVANDFDSFEMGLPRGFRDGKKLFDDIRKAMKVNETNWSTEEILRDAYIRGEIFNIGEEVETTDGFVGEIVRKGTNYVVLETNGEFKKSWITDLIEAKKITKTKQAKGEVGDVKGTQPAKYYSKDAEGDAMSKDTKLARAKYFAKGGSRKDAPGDIDPKTGERQKTKPSQYTKKFKQMYGEQEKEPAKSDAQKDREEFKKLQKDKKVAQLQYRMAKDAEMVARLSQQEKYDSDKFFGGKGTPAQRTQLLKLQNKALRALGGSPKQKEIKKEIDALRKKMGMKVSERKLTDAEKDKIKKLEKDIPMKDFMDRYGKDGKSVYYATLTKIAKGESIEEKDNPCWDTHKQVGMKIKNGKKVPNCVPKEEVSEGIKMPDYGKQLKQDAIKLGMKINFKPSGYFLLVGKDSDDFKHHQKIAKKLGMTATNYNKTAGGGSRTELEESMDEKNLTKSQQDKLDDLETYLGHLQKVTMTPARKAEIDITKKKIKKLKSEFEPEDDMNEMTGFNVPELIKTTIHRLTHPKGYKDLITKYMQRVKDEKKKSGHQDSNGFILADVGREFGFDRIKPIQMYINKLVRKGQLPQVLAAELEKEGDQKQTSMDNQLTHSNEAYEIGKDYAQHTFKIDPYLAPEKESRGYFTKTKSQSSKGKKLVSVVAPDIKKKLKGIDHKIEPDSTGTQIILTVDKSDVENVKKLVGLPNMVKVVSENPMLIYRGASALSKINPSTAAGAITTVGQGISKAKKYVSSKIGKKSSSKPKKTLAQSKKLLQDKTESYEIGKDYAQHTFKIDPYSAPEVLDEKIAGLVNKSEKTGVPYSILKKSYDRGMAAWKGGHRPGASQQQWAFARVNSMLTGGKADPDLQAQIKKGGYKKKKKAKKEEVTEWYHNENTHKMYEERYGVEWKNKLNITYEMMLSKLSEGIYDHVITEAEYQGRKVKLNDPFRLPSGSNKKFGVYVINDKGNVVKVTFGDPNMGINRDDPEARKNFRARHQCDTNPGPKYKARYWSCYQWRAGAKVDN